MSTNQRSRPSFAKWVIYSFIMMLLLIIQNTLALHISNVMLVLPAVIIIALIDDSITAPVLGGVFGLLWDITSGTVFGYNALLLLLFSVAAQLVANRLIRVKWLTSMISVVIFASIYQIITYVFFFLIFGNPGAWYTIFLALLRAGISAAIVGSLMFLIFRLLSKKLDTPS